MNYIQDNGWYAPAFMGKHTVDQQISLRASVQHFLSRWSPEPKVLDIDFLYDSEIKPYFENIFIPEYLNMSEFKIYNIYVVSKYRRKLTLMKHSLKRFVIEHNKKISMKFNKYTVMIGYNG